MAVLIYNKLCHEIKRVTRIMKFKKMIITYLLNKSFYSVFTTIYP